MKQKCRETERAERYRSSGHRSAKKRRREEHRNRRDGGEHNLKASNIHSWVWEGGQVKMYGSQLLITALISMYSVL